MSTLTAITAKKKQADDHWDRIFLRALHKEATQEELVLAMQLCNDADMLKIKFDRRQEADSLKNSKKTAEGAHYIGCGYLRRKDQRLFFSDGLQYVSSKEPYETITFEQVEKGE